MSVSSEVCYECGRGIPDGLGEPTQACLGVMPGGAQYWAWVEVCPHCARRADRHRRLWLALAFALVAALTSAIAIPLLP